MNAIPLLLPDGSESVASMCGRCRFVHSYQEDWSGNAARHVNRRSAENCCTCLACSGPTPERLSLYCDVCEARDSRERQRKADGAWAAMPRVEWDGETPLYSHRALRFFFSPDQLGDWLDREADHGDDRSIPDLELALCVPTPGRAFSMQEYLYDDMPEDEVPRLDYDPVDGVVNGWIAEHSPFSWEPTGDPVSVESVRKHLGMTGARP